MIPRDAPKRCREAHLGGPKDTDRQATENTPSALAAWLGFLVIQNAVQISALLFKVRVDFLAVAVPGSHCKFRIGAVHAKSKETGTKKQEKGRESTSCRGVVEVDGFAVGVVEGVGEGGVDGGGDAIGRIRL